MIKFIARHPIPIPFIKTPNPQIPHRLLYSAFEWMRIDDGVLETMIAWDSIVPVSKQTLLRAIGIPGDPEGFKVQELTVVEFQTFLNAIGYAGESKEKKFKKSKVPGLWTVLMYLILRGLSRKHGGTDTMRKDWLYVVYNIYFGKENVVDLTEVLWQDFRKFIVNRKPQEISILRFWALTIQQLYKERQEPITINTIIKEVKLKDFRTRQPLDSHIDCQNICWPHYHPSPFYWNIPRRTRLWITQHNLPKSPFRLTLVISSPHQATLPKYP